MGQVLSGQVKVVSEVLPQGVRVVFGERAPANLYWCVGSDKHGLQVALIPSGQLEENLADLIAHLCPGQPASVVNDLAFRLNRHAAVREGGVAMLALLNATLVAEGVELNALDDADHPQQVIANSILDNAVSAARNLQMSLVHGASLPWRQNFQASIGMEVAIPVVMPEQDEMKILMA
ncbi:hypothetical protein DU506_01415 [Vreelandella rituensis]|uniref:Uncharacterized protein n=2 Tax=Vreelandella rituensis TaxID=2282306 RepID=A0A368UA41_9GAMM|nr:hypothetical protein DU506_01415 [Halomonas rituensis]